MLHYKIQQLPIEREKFSPIANFHYLPTIFFLLRTCILVVTEERQQPQNKSPAK